MKQRDSAKRIPFLVQLSFCLISSGHNVKKGSHTIDLPFLRSTWAQAESPPGHTMVLNINQLLHHPGTGQNTKRTLHKLPVCEIPECSRQQRSSFVSANICLNEIRSMKNSAILTVSVATPTKEYWTPPS